MSNQPRPGPDPDPDRFFDLKSNGAHEWWYFDAISDDGRDVLVIIFYAGLPFDPSYGVAAIRHARNPTRAPQPDPLDHAAVGLSWHRDGKQVAYALSGHERGGFDYRADPFEVRVATSRVARDPDGSYRLTVLTPAVDKRAIRASLRFTPAAATEPVERNLGSSDHPHHWILAAPDCRVEGTVTVGTEVGRFRGRGYHDHNAGAEEMSLAMRRWEWGRVHIDDRTHVYYNSLPQPGRGEPQSLWITCVDGRPRDIRETDPAGVCEAIPQRTVFGIKHARFRSIQHRNALLTRITRTCLDDGPFYRRWTANFSCSDWPHDQSEPPPPIDEFRLPKPPPGSQKTWAEPAQDLGGAPGPLGIAELLDTRHMNRWYVNWMIPYRLKRPKGDQAAPEK